MSSHLSVKPLIMPEPELQFVYFVGAVKCVKKPVSVKPVNLKHSATGEPVLNLPDNASADKPPNIYAQPVMTPQNKLSHV